MAYQDAEQLLAEGYSIEEISAAKDQLLSNALDACASTMKDQAVQDLAMKKAFGGRAQNVDWSNPEVMNTGQSGAWRRVRGLPKV
jgi:hypothetical protein